MNLFNYNLFIYLYIKQYFNHTLPLPLVEETERLRPYEDSAFDEKSARGGPDHRESEATPSERYAPSHFSDRYPQSQASERYGPPTHPPPAQHGPPQPRSERYAPSQNSERWVGSQPPPQDEYMLDDPNR